MLGNSKHKHSVFLHMKNLLMECLILGLLVLIKWLNWKYDYLCLVFYCKCLNYANIFGILVVFSKSVLLNLHSSIECSSCGNLVKTKYKSYFCNYVCWCNLQYVLPFFPEISFCKILSIIIDVYICIYTFNLCNHVHQF